jgi:diguanylate cyclase (GGDEF)-like protein
VQEQWDSDRRPGDGSSAGRMVLEVSAQHAALLAKLRAELGPDESRLGDAAERLAVEFGPIAATAVDAALKGAPVAVENFSMAAAEEEQSELASLFRPGQMRRRLEQLIESHHRYDHPFALAVFDASGPDTRGGDGDGGGGRETVMAIVGVALRESIRVVDEVFRLEEDAICVLAPNLRTVEGVQMAERLLEKLDDLERMGGLRIAIAAGVVACPEHGADADQLLQKADAALWRARAVGQPVGVGALEPVQDR